MRSQLLRRGAALAAVSALTVTTLGALSSPASAHPAGDRAVGASAIWLKGQLQSGVLQGSFGPEIGPSIDAGLAFDAIDRGADAVAVADGIAPHLVTTANFEYGYARSTEYKDDGTVQQIGRYANATAKAAAFVSRLGLDPSTNYPDIDLIAQLEDLTSDTTGLIADDSFYGNYANSIGQAFAVEALTAAGSPEAGAATSALLQQQCAAGNFRFDLDTVACTGADIIDTDQTSLAILSLLSSGTTTAPVTQAIQEAATWLADQQGTDGSFGAGGDQGPNANSTGLAAWALSQTGNTAAATRAGGWLRAVQVADLAPCVTTLSAENGAVAPKPATLAATRTAGSIAAGQRITYAFATAQALPALASVPAGTGPLAVSAPATAVEKSAVTVTVAGLGAGEAGCVSFGGVAKPVTGTGADVSVTFDLPAGAGARTFTLTTLGGSQTASTTATLAPVATPSPTANPTATPTTAPTPTPTTAPTPTPTPADPVVGKLEVAKVKKNKFTLEVTCASTVTCDGKIVVRTAGKVKLAKTMKPTKVLVARKAYSVKPGETSKVVLKVEKRARTVFANDRVKVKAVQSAKGADQVVTKFWLRTK